MRRFTVDDGPGLHSYLSREEAVRYEPYLPMSQAEAEHLAHDRSTDDRFWAVCRTQDGALVGNLFLAACEPAWWRTWELGYVFHPDHWGQGLATEACRELVDRTFADGAHRVMARCDPRNVRSWALLERIGMRREAHHVQAAAFWAGADGSPRWHDTYVYAVLADDWAAWPSPRHG
ncbi:MAG: GNAT family N-acetyltransferase [Cellulomonadaceae bacterium]|nr:GNAT family N-acetyltransferase [Cellulomonadaceae bacterium]